MAEPIRVCEFMGNMNGGGVESVVMNYYRHIDRSKVQFDFVITESSAIVPRKEMLGLGARVFMVPPYTELLAFQKASYRLFCSHPEWKIVHAHMNALNVFPLKQAAKAGIPVRISHSHSTAGKGEFLKNTVKIVLKTQANKYPTDRFACSEFAGEWLFGKSSSFTLMHNAIDVDSFVFSSDVRTSIRKDLGFEDSFVIGHVGRFVTQKNHRFLLEVFKRVAEKRDDALLVLVGSGKDESSAKSWVVEHGLQDRVRFLGQRDDVDRLYQGFDVFTLPSIYEGLGIVAIEAQASGLPCLLSDRITREVDVTGTCKFLSLSNVETWAEELSTLEPKDDAERRDVKYTEFTNYDIAQQGKWLTNKYQELYKEINK